MATFCAECIMCLCHVSFKKLTKDLLKFYNELLVGDRLRVSEVPGFVECIAVLG